MFAPETQAYIRKEGRLLNLLPDPLDMRTLTLIAKAAGREKHDNTVRMLPQTADLPGMFVRQFTTDGTIYAPLADGLALLGRPPRVFTIGGVIDALHFTFDEHRHFMGSVLLPTQWVYCSITHAEHYIGYVLAHRSPRLRVTS